MTKTLTELENQIGYKFKDQGIILIALTHPSYLNENKEERDSYQRLEFLGDAILEFVASLYLFREFTDIREGRLTEIRAALVRTENLAHCALKFNLGDYLFISKGEEQNQGRRNENILADVLEALIAALYLDSQQLKTVETFFDRYIKEELDAIIKNKLYLDSKTELQELIQAKHKLTPVYKVLKETQSAQQNQFEIGVFLKERCLATGIGRNKRAAEQQAAKNALGNKTKF